MRAGTGGPKNIVLKSGLQSIDVTDVETPCWIRKIPFTKYLPFSHSYAFDVPEVLGDIAVVLRNGQSPTGRNLKQRSRDERSYYVIEDN
jgi:hypothetical protein